MPRALVIHCHPDPDSFTAAIRDRVLARLAEAGAEVRLHDLYAEGFDPVLSRAEWRGYADSPANRAAVARQVADLQWCDTLIFIYPTWWHGLPAMLKGWLDRVLLPGVAFDVAEGGPIRPGLRHVRALGVFTTCGASRWASFLTGAPGRRTLLRGLRMLCARRCRVAQASLYLIDTTTPAQRAAHLDRVSAAVDRLIAARRGG